METLALTFDDGPDPEGTPAVLGALRAAGARATFFVIAPRAERHPELVEQIVAAGHGVGVHCDEHVRHSERDAAWVAADLRRALARLDALDLAPTLWRTPWGDVADGTAEAARQTGLELVRWTADTHDWRGDSAEQMFADTHDQLRAGAVVLAHDGIGPGARRSDVTQTARYVALAAAHATQHGLTLAAL